MEGLNFENVTQLLQLVAIVCGIGIFWWKVPSKREMERADDLLRVDIRENQKQIRIAFDKIDANFHRLIDKMDADSKEFHANMSKLNDKIDANAQEFHVSMNKLNDKIDANAQEFHVSMSKLNDKIDASTRAIYEKIDAEARDLRTEIRELNQDHKAHLAYHNEKAQS